MISTAPRHLGSGWPAASKPPFLAWVCGGQVIATPSLRAIMNQRWRLVGSP
jgi:hypothetical protein